MDWIHVFGRRCNVEPVRHFFSRWQNWVALGLVLFYFIVAAAAPLLSPQDPANPGPMKVVGERFAFKPSPPSSIAPLGTTSNQASIYHALVWGTRSALAFAGIVTLISAVVGVMIGILSGYFEGWVNSILMRITDAFLSFPVIAGVVVIQQLITILLFSGGVRIYPQGPLLILPSGDFTFDLPFWYAQLLKIDSVMVALILLSWMSYARIMNTVVLRLKRSDYIFAARAVGVRNRRIIFKHLLPNAIAPAIVLAARDIGAVVVLQSTFGFIGFGKGSPWSMILVNGRDWIYSPGGIFTYWWVFLPATLAIILFGLSWNMLGDGLNDALNPRSR